MRVTIAAVALLLAGFACSSNNKPAASGSGFTFTLTGAVQSVAPGDKPSQTPSGVNGIAGSMTVNADKPITGCDNPSKVYFTSSTTGSGAPGSVNGKRVTVTGNEYPGCVLVADTISLATAGSGGSSGTTGGAVTSPGTVVPSASPAITKGPAPEGVIEKETPSVAPAGQKK